MIGEAIFVAEAVRFRGGARVVLPQAAAIGRTGRAACGWRRSCAGRRVERIGMLSIGAGRTLAIGCRGSCLGYVAIQLAVGPGRATGRIHGGAEGVRWARRTDAAIEVVARGAVRNGGANRRIGAGRGRTIRTRGAYPISGRGGLAGDIGI